MLAQNELVTRAPAELDLSVTDLYGWEKQVSSRTIREFIAAIHEGARFPRVPVVDRGAHFSLAYWINRTDMPDFPDLPDGGHHRSVAHYLAEVALPVEVVSMPSGPGFEYFNYFETRHISEVRIR